MAHPQFVRRHAQRLQAPQGSCVQWRNCRPTYDLCREMQTECSNCRSAPLTLVAPGESASSAMRGRSSAVCTGVRTGARKGLESAPRSIGCIHRWSDRIVSYFACPYRRKAHASGRSAWNDWVAHQ